MLKFLFGGKHFLTTITMLFIAYLTFVVAGMDFFWGTIYIVFALILWLCRGIITNAIASIIASKKNKGITKPSDKFKWEAIDLKNLELVISTILFVILVILPFLLVFIFAGMANIISTLMTDLTMQNGIGWLIFAVVEILVTIAAVIAIYVMMNKLSGKSMFLGIIVAGAVQRIVSAIYFFETYANFMAFVFDTLLFAVMTAIIYFIGSLVIGLVSRHRP